MLAQMDYAEQMKASPVLASSPKLDVPATTLIASNMARQQATAAADTQMAMADTDGVAPVGPAGLAMSSMGGSKGEPSSAMLPVSSDAVDDIVSKVLVAMGAVSQT